MSANSSIEWTESTWNPVTGCSKVSAGCANCYAERMAKRLQAMGQANYVRGFEVSLHPESVELPLRWKKPQTIFVNSMSDLFHEEIPEAFIRRIFGVMKQAHWHRFQVLTKRSERLVRLAPKLEWPGNVWMGVSVENQKCAERIEDLRVTPAAIKFLSMEPLIGPVNKLNLQGIDWVIVGGESGPGARPIQEDWVTDIRDACLSASVPFFFKQWGGFHKKKAGRKLEGKLWSQMPEMRTEHEMTVD